MDYRWFLQILTLISPVVNLAQKNDTEMFLIIDFIKSQYSPNMVLENLCWKRDLKNRLYTELIRNDIRYASYKEGNNSQFTDWLLQNGYFKFTVLVDLNCNFDFFFNQAIKSSLLIIPNVWLVFGDSTLLETTNYYIPINSIFVVPRYNLQANNWEIIALYQTYRHLNRYIENYFGTWTLEDGLKMVGPIMLTRNRSDFMGMPLRISYLLTHNSSYEHLTDYREKHIDAWTKINFILLQYVCDFWNTTHIKVYQNDWGYKSVHPTKFYTAGLLGDLLHDKADVAGSGTFLRLQHYKYFFVPNFNFKISFFFKAPSLAFSSNLFLLPFERKLWIAIGFFALLGGTVVRLILKWEKTESTFARQAEEEKENYPKTMDVIMMQLAIICQMDFFYEPKSVTGKLVTFVVLMTFVFIYTAYTARIVLLLQATSKNIKDVGDLYKAGYDFGTEDYTFNRFYFSGLGNRTNEYWRKIIYEEKMKPKPNQNFLATSEGIRRVGESYFAFNVEHEAAFFLIQQHFTNEQICALGIADSIFKTEVLYLFVIKNSSYIEFLTVSGRRLSESGIHMREAGRCFTKKPACQGTGSSFVSVGITECYFPILFFWTGFFLSIIILILEILTDYFLKTIIKKKILFVKQKDTLQE